MWASVRTTILRGWLRPTLVVMCLILGLQRATSHPAAPPCCALNGALFSAPSGAPPWEKAQCPPPSFQLPQGSDGSGPASEFSAAECRSSPDACRIQPLTPPDTFVKCLDDLSHDYDDTTVPHLRSVAAWRSNKASALPFTVVTQLNMDRLPQLWAQCRTWKGPLSAAMHVVIPPHEEVNKDKILRCAVQQIGAFHTRLEGMSDVCALDLTLVMELLPDHLAYIKYPINALRNIARLQARTEVLVLLDIDLLVATMFSMPTAEQLYPVTGLCRDKKVVVLPAFEVFESDERLAIKTAEELVAGNKTTVLAGVSSGQVGLFASRHFSKGHAPTDLVRWSTTDQFYQIDYVTRFEPFLVVSRLLSPWHDVRFRGYGQNKIVHVAHLNATGFKFVVHPAAYMVHRAHTQSPARVQFSQEIELRVRSARDRVPFPPQESSLFAQVKTLYQLARKQMSQGIFVPIVAPSTEACRRQLSWWP